MNCLLRGLAGEVTVFASPGSLLAGICRQLFAGAVTAFLQSDLYHIYHIGGRSCR